MLHDPRFVHGPDVQQNLLRAIGVVQAEARQAQQQVFEGVPRFQELRQVMANIVESGHADNILDAYRLALNHQASLQKAKRAAPVKSSSGANPNPKASGDNLDAIISRAMGD